MRCGFFVERALRSSAFRLAFLLKELARDNLITLICEHGQQSRKFQGIQRSEFSRMATVGTRTSVSSSGFVRIQSWPDLPRNYKGLRGFCR